MNMQANNTIPSLDVKICKSDNGTLGTKVYKKINQYWILPQNNEEQLKTKTGNLTQLQPNSARDQLKRTEVRRTVILYVGDQSKKNREVKNYEFGKKQLLLGLLLWRRQKIVWSKRRIF